MKFNFTFPTVVIKETYTVVEIILFEPVDENYFIYSGTTTPTRFKVGHRDFKGMDIQN